MPRIKIHSGVSINKNIKKLYESPLPSKRSGALFNAFPYPTKISPEAIAIYIACHTNVGDTILDPFAGSGTTGLAGLLCDCPTDEMKKIANDLGVKPKWGARKIILQELSALGAFVANTMCNPPDPGEFETYSNQLIDDVEKKYKPIYEEEDNSGVKGEIRYTIWSDILECPKCKTQITYWDSIVNLTPLSLSPEFVCEKCGYKAPTKDIGRVTEYFDDVVLGEKVLRKRRVPVKAYGKTGKRTWQKILEQQEMNPLNKSYLKKGEIPKVKVKWGDLYRKGYHTGITHVHQFYTEKNLAAFSQLWNNINKTPEHLRSSLKLLTLSYNASHATLMSRVVVKKNNADFVLTGAQSGVLYISSLPVEKNVFQGVRRKIKTFKNAFELVFKSKSSVKVFNASSTKLKVTDKSIDYIFTDPPFGGYIPYSEINQLNEAWLGLQTQQEEEIIVSSAQSKSEDDYGELMSKVFVEMQRVLKDGGKSTVVFHSAKASIWKTLMNAYENAGFSVTTSSILDKVQGSFKQVTSNVKVQGDPLLLLEKKNKKVKVVNGHSSKEIIDDLLKSASLTGQDSDERKPERLYSRFVARCLELQMPVSMNAEDFYIHIEQVGKGVLV